MAIPARHRPPIQPTPTQAYPNPVSINAYVGSMLWTGGAKSRSASYQSLIQSMLTPPKGGLHDRLYDWERVREFYTEHTMELAKILEEDSPHQNMLVRGNWLPESLNFKIVARCHACERTMSVTIPAESLQGDDWERVMVREMAQLVETACQTQCFGIRERAMLAEWATSRLHRAGERGVPYVQLVHEAVGARMVAPADIDGVLRDMKFVPEWVTLANSGIILPGGWDGQWSLPVLHLPQGHPLRTW